jgi:hypothetical protein
MIIKSLHASEEEEEAIALIVGLIVSFELLYNFHELTHDQREDGHSKQKAESDKDPLQVRAGIEVTETHSCQTCEGKVD